MGSGSSGLRSSSRRRRVAARPSCRAASARRSSSAPAPDAGGGGHGGDQQDLRGHRRPRRPPRGPRHPARHRHRPRAQAAERQVRDHRRQGRPDRRVAQGAARADPSRHGVSPRRRGEIGLLPLVAILFFNVSGGPSGVEDAVGSLGPGLALLLLVVTPLVWSLPVSLAMAELASALPEEGGYVVWVQRAFGRFWGFQAGWWSWINSFVDVAVYPALFADYLAFWRPGMSTLERWAIVLAFVWILTAVNLAGVRITGWTAVALHVGGTWLAHLVTLGAVVAAAGLFLSLLLTNSRLPYVLARDGQLPPALGRLHPRFGTPWAAVVLSSVGYSVCAFWSFKELIVLNIWLYSIALLLEMAAFVALRLREPALPRPWRVGGSATGMWLVAGLPALCCLLAMATAGWANTTVGVLAALTGPLAYWLWRAPPRREPA